MELSLDDKHLNSSYQELFDANIKLVYHYVKKHSYFSEELEKEDVYQDGKLGLFLAAKTFDPSKNVAFSTWAYYWIKASISRSQAKFTFLKWPNKKYIIRNKIIQFWSRYYNLHGENPELDDIITALEDLDAYMPITSKDITIVYHNILMFKKSLTNKTGEANQGFSDYGNEILLESIVVPQESAEDRLVKKRSVELNKCLYKLPHFERFIIEKRYLEEYTLEDIRNLWSEITGKTYTREWIRQKEKTALKKMKRFMEEFDV